MDFESVAAEFNKDEKQLHKLGLLAQQMMELESWLERVEQQRKDYTAQLYKIQQEDIPALMAELGMKSFVLNDGTELKITKYYGASIKEADKDQAFTWLIDNGYADLIKNTVSASFVRGQEDKAEKLEQELLDRNLATSRKIWIEPMTLKAFVRECVEQGKELPTQLFNVIVGDIAKLKQGKSEL